MLIQLLLNHLSSPGGLVGLDYTKSLRANGEMDKFRISFMAVLWKKLRVVEGPIRWSEEAVAYKNLILRLLPDDVAFAPMTEALLRYAPGDWMDPDHFDFCMDGVDNKEDAMTILKTEFLPFIIGHVPFRYPAGKWSGYEKCYRDCGVPLGMNDLLHDTYSHYLRNHHTTEVRSARGVAPDGLLAIADIEVVEKVPSPAAGATVIASTMADTNKAHRGSTVTWLQTRPLPCLL